MRNDTWVVPYNSLTYDGFRTLQGRNPKGTTRVSFRSQSSANFPTISIR